MVLGVFDGCAKEKPEMKSELRVEVLETPRLILRPFSLDDAERLTALLQDPDVHRWTASIPYPYTNDHAVEFISKRLSDDFSGDSFAWAITDRKVGHVIGGMGLHDVVFDRGRAELGYWMGAEYRGVGYATEAARRILSWCFEVAEFHRVQATYVLGNHGSAGVMRNIGMQEEGLLRGYGFKNGEHQDMYLNAILRDDRTWISTADQLAGM
jgi:ribosomal-protein-alanine N-acetyltransferase